MDLDISNLLDVIGMEHGEIADVQMARGLSNMPRVIIAVICSYLQANDVLCKLPMINKQMAITVRQEDLFWKALNAEMNEYNQKIKSKIDEAYIEKDFEKVKKL